MGIIYTPTATWATTATLAEDAVDDDAAATWNGPIQTALDRTQWLYGKRCISRSFSTIGATNCPGNGTNTVIFTGSVGTIAIVGARIEVTVGAIISYTGVESTGICTLRININDGTAGLSAANFAGNAIVGANDIFLMHKHIGVVAPAGSTTCTVSISNGTAAPAKTYSVVAWQEILVWGA